MNDQQLLRYSRHILLPEIGVEGQQQFLDAKVLVIGLGGLGSPVVLYLAAAGIGHLTLVDFDHVDISNLQRQIIHDQQDLDSHKTASAQASAKRINPDISLHTINRRLTEDELYQLCAKHDAVIDGSDNFETRFMLNRACHASATALISGAVIRLQGQVTTFDFSDASAPCYRCLYDEHGDNDESCTANGILAPVAGIVGSIQATETLKLIAGLPILSGELLRLDALTMQFRKTRLRKDPDCPVCGGKNDD